MSPVSPTSLDRAEGLSTRPLAATSRSSFASVMMLGMSFREQEPPYPPEGFSVDEDRMYRTAEVTSHDGTDNSSVNAMVTFWVRVSTWEDEFERALLKTILGWLRDD